MLLYQDRFVIAVAPGPATNAFCSYPLAIVRNRHIYMHGFIFVNISKQSLFLHFYNSSAKFNNSSC